MIPKEKFERGIVWAGINQTMRMIDRKENIDVVLIANDVEPREIIMPLENAVKENNIEHYFATKSEIGKIAGCPRPASAACVLKK